jgi:hypothetical protein
VYTWGKFVKFMAYPLGIHDLSINLLCLHCRRERRREKAERKFDGEESMAKKKFDGR